MQLRCQTRARVGRGPPAGEQRAGRNDPLRGGQVGLAGKMPNFRIAVRVGMGIPGQDVGGNVLCQIPRAVATLDRQINGCEVA